MIAGSGLDRQCLASTFVRVMHRCRPHFLGVAALALSLAGCSVGDIANSVEVHNANRLRAIAISKGLGNGIPSADVLAAIAQTDSLDIATLVFVEKANIEGSRRPAYAKIRESIDAGQFRSGRIEAGLSAPVFLLVPGWLYKTNPTTGADLEEVRRMLQASGFKVFLVETGENATVSQNAKVVAAAIREWASKEARIVVISASKGGAETLAALKIVESTPAGGSVRAWINVGGLINGSHLASLALRWPICAIVKWMVVPDARLEAIESMRPAAPQITPADADFLEKILVVNVVAVPMTQDIAGDASVGFAILRRRGPNDGMTLLSDAVVTGGVTIPVIGADHYFRTGYSKRIMRALLHGVSGYLAEENVASFGSAPVQATQFRK